MIQLLPLEQGERLKELCEQYSIDYAPQLRAYVSADETICAQCVFAPDTYRIELLAASFDESDPLLPELLIRAVGAYAANRSGYLFYVPAAVGQAMEDTLLRMHFEKNDTGYCGKVPQILKGTCRC